MLCNACNGDIAHEPFKNSKKGRKSSHWNDAKINKDANLTALVRLGNRAKIPVYIVFYATDHTMFRVIPMNTYASVRQKAMDLFGDDI